MKVDVAIVGGGPAGLTAAKEIAQRGGSVVVLDENARFGGKLLGQLHEEPQHQRWWKGAEIAQKLENEAVEAGAKLIPQTLVWGLEKGWTIYTSDILNRDHLKRKITAKVLLLATGAVEKPLPVSGWTLPGVMTVGAAQVLTNVYQVKPGNRVLIVGVDVLSITIARALQLAGVEVVGIVLPKKDKFSKSMANPTQLLEQFSTMVHLAPSRLLKVGGIFLQNPLGIKLAARFFPSWGVKMWGIPLLLKKALLEIQGEEQVERVKIASINAIGEQIEGSGKWIDVDAVCLSGGLTPLGELAVTAGCTFVRLKGLSGVVPLHGPSMETNVESLFVAGNITGIEGAKIAMAQGELAGVSICRKLGLGNVTDRDCEIQREKVANLRQSADIQFHSEVEIARRKLHELWEQYG